MNTDEKKKVVWIAKIVISLLIGVLSFGWLANVASSTSFHEATIASLDEKKTTVMELAAASTAASAAITLIPGDTATPIATKLADLSGYFLVILCAIYLEKYLVTITGYAAFKVLLPIACGIFIANVFTKSEALQRIAIKLGAFGIIIFLAIPSSVKISNMIEATYGSSIDETIDAAKESTETVEESAQESDGDEEGFLSKLLSKIEGGVSQVVDGFEETLSNFVEAIAVLIVTSCIIPLVVLLFFVWITKLLFGINLAPMTKRQN